MNRSTRRKLKFLYRGACNTLLLRTLYRKKFDIRQTLVIAGTTRSGSTWLAEIVSAGTDCGQIFEPLSPEHVSAARRAGVSFDTYAENPSDWPRGKDLMEKILSGKLLTPWTTSQIPIGKARHISRVVVKFVRANLLLGWITANFPIKTPALVIRHPCATISSQMNKLWPLPTAERILEYPYFRKIPELKDRCKRLSEPEEILALLWCMRYHAPFSLPDPHPFILLTYEGLVRQGRAELRRLYERWHLPVPPEALARLKVPSMTVTRESQVLTGKDPLTGWRKHLSKKQIENILRVVDLFGMDFYSEDVEPDYARLESGNIVSPRFAGAYH